jgi:hypothetical protein
VSPRAAPTRDDETARRFLNAAAVLIDAALAGGAGELPRRLRSIRFPAALDWLRVADVVQLAQVGGEAASKKAFLNRWPTKDAFLRDAVIHALLYRDGVAGPPPVSPDVLAPQVRPASLSEAVRSTADSVLTHLLGHPRSYLLMHLGPMLGSYPDIADALAEESELNQENWAAGYVEILDGLQCGLRPGWTPTRLALALQLLVDGCLLRYRIEPHRCREAAWTSVSFFAEIVTAFVVGVVDVPETGLSAAEWLDSARVAAG